MLAHKTAGHGTPFLLLHAFPLSSAMWEDDLEWLERRCHVIAPDLPGFGRSPRQLHPSIPGMAREVGLLLEELGIQQPMIVAGLSMGGYVAFEFLRHFPERVRALGLFSTRAVMDAPEARTKRFKTAEEIQEKGLEVFARAALPNLVGKTTAQTRPDVLRRITEMITANEPGGVADSLLAMADRRDSIDLLAGIHCPTRVVAGAEDSFIPVEQARAMQAQIPGSRLVVIEKAGHLVNLEQPAPFQQAIQEFITEAGGL